VFYLFSGFLITGAANAQAAKEAPGKLPTLTTAHQVHSLSSEEASRAYPVHLRGVITYFDQTPSTGDGAMFVQDATGSVFVKITHQAMLSLSPGTMIDLHGVSNAGEFAPIVAEPKLVAIGSASFPKNPRRPTLSILLAGLDDGQWVEVEGVIHSVVAQDRYIFLQLNMPDGVISIMMVREAGIDYTRLVDAKVRIQGNPGPLFDVGRRQMIAVNIHCPGLSAIQVEEAPPKDPYLLPVIPINKLLQWDIAPLLAHRVHVQGRVTLQWPGLSVCIHDATQGVCAQTDQNTPLRNGEVVDIVGFAHAEGSAPMLTDAVFRSASESAAAPVTAEPITAEQALFGKHGSQLIQVDGQLISRDLAAVDTTLLLSSGQYIFKVILPRALSGPQTNDWKNGSVLRVTGICSVQLDTQKSAMGIGTAVPISFRVLMRSPGDVIVLHRPSWWTPDHALIVLALALCGTLFVLAWVVVLRRRVEQQTILLRESEQRFRHMALHDALTGLATRLLLEDRLNASLETAKRHQAGLGLLMVDLDKFKDINDTYGHQAGDEVLRVTADRLLEAVRLSDTVARMGGDEFVILLSDLREPKMAERIAANIVKSLALPVPFDGYEIPITVSVGVCSASVDEMNADAMLKQADAALYCAKERGRNRFEVFAS
jgi:diguanylate cyclase (GGDEF)-like protein